MGFIGKSLRQRRLLFKNTNIALIVPIDHGLTVGPLNGLRNSDEINGWIGSDDISAVIVHKGMLERLVRNRSLSSEVGVILHLNGMSVLAPEVDKKQMITTIKSALRLGADGVSLQVNFTDENYQHNIKMLGKVTDAASEAGLPVLSMLYDKTPITSLTKKIARMNNLIRLMIEMGVDMVKIPFPETKESTQEIISSHCEDIMILCAGGEPTDNSVLYESIKMAMSSGARGLCIGRNVFQSVNPKEMLSELRRNLQ